MHLPLEGVAKMMILDEMNGLHNTTMKPSKSYHVSPSLELTK